MTVCYRSFPAGQFCGIEDDEQHGGLDGAQCFYDHTGSRIEPDAIRATEHCIPEFYGENKDPQQYHDQERDVFEYGDGFQFEL